ncbi:MAG TPA: hypothetical protein ACFCUC_16505 [Desulfobacterales bacterium]
MNRSIHLPFVRTIVTLSAAASQWDQRRYAMDLPPSAFALRAGIHLAGFCRICAKPHEYGKLGILAIMPENQ